MQKLALDTQSFETLRNNDCVYVDKTEVIYRMITSGRIYFLSRPRRFGKSLLVSTLEAIFKGRKKLFKGLYIYDKWKWKQYPVIKIDWTKINHSTPEEMKESLVLHLNEIAQNYQITLGTKSVVDCFRILIETLQKKNGKNVVILIDEYDKPVTAHLSDHHLEKIKTDIHDFYQVMKGSDDYLQFVFLTGVSKFSGLSIFSALNNPRDITLRKEYATICGYTQEELESNFSEYIDNAAEYLKMTKEKTLEQIRYWYNGYTWDGETAIYNPFSTMNFFEDRRFDNYWFSTGTPTFLIDIIQYRNSMGVIFEPIVIDHNIFKGYNPYDLSEVPLLFQTGYLTIKQMELTDGIPRYTLGIPNSEVNDALLTCLLLAYGKYRDDQIDKLRTTIKQQITDCDESGFARTLESMVAAVPSNLHVAGESYYHSLMLIWMRLIGFEVHGEVPNNIGRSDIVWEQPNFAVVAEIKFHAKKKIDTLLKEAITQIREKRYYNRYTGKVLLLGIAFSGKNAGCRMEVIKNKSQNK
jgi:hypothetical protein